MVVGEASINNIMGGIENTGGVRLHNHKKKLKQRFDIIKKLGQGTYGKVQLGINKETGQEVAIKTIKKSKIETEADLVRIRREIQIMSSVQHPNIIHIYEVFENREKMVLVMEYAAGGELYDYLSERKVLAEEEARRIFRQIATACYYCHKHKICHRDLKLENILLDENGNAKIADFGLSNVFDDTRLLSTFCGSPLYASPEIVKGTPYHGPEVDCWSLGVLLYTLVYGAMPFDGSNFKRLVKQISQGDYFEPKKPSPASPLIKEMLTVNPKTRADIEKICAHWWVNEGYDESCLDISEYLANQTPVRLDLLLSLAPPPPQLESDKLVVTGDVPEEPVKPEAGAPVRSQSVGSLMELSHPAEKRIKDLLSEEVKTSPKRKLENAVSSDHANISNRKDKIVKENTIADISVHATIQENASQEDASMTEAVPLDKSRTQTLSRDMDVEQTEEDLSLQGAACAEIIEDSKKNEVKKPIKIKKTVSTTLSNKILEEINENPSQESLCNKLDKENVSQEQENKIEEKVEKKVEEPKQKKKLVKKVLADRDENVETPIKQQNIAQSEQPQEAKENKVEEKSEAVEFKPEEMEHKPVERRRSRIYEQAEKFQNLIAASESKSGIGEKPKKVILPGVSVDGYKEKFERKASLTSTSPPKVKGNIPKRISIDKQASIEQAEKTDAKLETEPKTTTAFKTPAANLQSEKDKENKAQEKKEAERPVEDERKKQLRNAVSIISSALDKEGTRKSKSRPCIRKPPVPFGSGGRSASGSIGMISSPMSPVDESQKTLKLQIGPNPTDTRLATVQVSTPEQIKYEQGLEGDNKTSSAKITLKSATLPRRKTSKAEIKLNYPQPKPATMEFKTEMAHHIEAPPKLPTQRSEAVFPVSAAPTIGLRSASVEPETKVKQLPKERIIPISFEKSTDDKKEQVLTPPSKPPTPKILQNQKSFQSQRSNSLSRQSTQESDSETTVSGSGEPIRKSPREYIIPIAVEGGGYVTPRAGSLEPSDTASTTSTMTNSSRRTNKFGRARRMNSILSDRDGSEDESPFSLHRHSSFGKDSDTEDSRKDAFHMHRLRSSRPRKANLEHADSLSSGEEDDDDGFEILTAENLFSTLLSRVRDLTQRINVDDGGRPGFPSSRLLSHFNHGTNFWNMQNRMDPFSSRTTPLGRTFSRERSVNNSSSGQLGAPWRRSVSRDLATDIESVFNDSRTPTQTATLPRGDKKTKKDDLNLSDLNLKKLKLTEEDAIALSYLTPGLSRRIQQQLFAQLPPSEARKLTRTMSLRNPAGKNAPEDKNVHNRECSPTDKNSTLPRRYSVESSPLKYSNSAGKCTEKFAETPKIQEQEPYGSGTTGGRNYSPYNDRSTKSDYEAECFSASKSRALRSASLREPRTHYLAPKLDLYSRRSPDSSISDSTSYKNDDSSLSCKNDSLTDHGCKTSSISNPDYSFGISLAAPYSYTPESSTLSKYLSSNKYEVPRSYSPTYGDLEKKTEVKRPSITSRRISRFLRPDFYDKPKEENVYFKEKKEREMETQKVLKEIRDKRKGRLNLRRERSASRESSKTEPESGSESVGKKYDAKSKLAPADESVENLHLPTKPDDIDSRGNKNDLLEDTNSILKDVSASIKNIESNVKVMPNYVNVPNPAANKVSKLTRPKSYPIENLAKKSSPPLKESPEKDTKSKISRLKKGVSPQRSRDKEKTPPKVNSGEKTSNKNRFLQSIEKKFEKLRSFSSPSREGSDKKTKEDKKSSVESAIKRLREQSLPRNIDHCITESGLIKRAVSVEDLSTLGGLGSSTKELQPSRKSVTKILGLFKKYEEKDKKGEKVSKLKKPKEVKAEKTDANKESQLKSKKVTGNKTASKNAASNVKTDENVQVKKSKIPSFNEPPVRNEKQTKECNNKKISESDTKQKVDRPRSLLYDQVKQYQNSYNSAKSDTAITNDSAKSKLSKLPLNSYRRSLNLDNSQTSDPPKFYKNPSKNNINEYCNRNDILNGNESNLSTDINENTEYSKLDRRNLKLDFSKVPIANVSIEPTPSTSTSDNQENCRDNRNSLTTTDDSSAFLSPCDDMSCDSWSVCSDYHTHDVLSPISPNGHIYSGDESESVIDRIRRKSFYTRFNEKKRPKKTSLGGNYRDLDLYKDYSQRKTGYRSPSDYGSLDRRSVDYRPDRRLSYNPVPDSIKKEYKPYTRSSSLLNDYVNVPNRYQTYNPRMNTHNPSLYSPEIEEHAMDDNVSTGKSKINSYYSQPSRTTHRPTSVSPCIENSFIDQRSSSLNQNSVASPTSQSSL